ncbi:MAG: FapA family protein [Bacillota bacterium]
MLIGTNPIQDVIFKGQESLKHQSPEHQNKDGYIEVVLGRAVVSDPIGDGRYASINPCDPNIDVYVNGDSISEITIVTEKDRIEFESRADGEGITEISVEILDDGMKAVLTIDKSPGRQYYVKDVPKTSLLNVSSDYREIPAPDVTLAQCLQELKKVGVDLKSVDGTVANMLVGQRYGGSAVVAEGKYPVDGRDSVVEYLFKKNKYRNPDFDTDKKVDLLDHTIMPTVKVGEVLAKKVSFAIPGRDGQTVTGETVKARQGRDIPLKAGNGAILLHNDTRIVAVSSGRPMFKNGMVVVAPQLVISRNVDPGTGNIYFDGDIRIKGSVMDNMKVVAEGDITVLGNVLQASLTAGGIVNIVGNIISSRVYAGRGVANSLCILPKIQQIHSIIMADFYDVNSEVWLNGYKKMRKRFPDMCAERVRKMETLIKDIKAVLSLVPEREAELMEGILEGLDRVYGRGGIGVGTKLINRLNEDIQSYLQAAEGSNHMDADLRFGYAQNSSVQANGDVIITGRGTYQTDIIAKRSINFLKASSVVRGGMLIAGKRIDMGVVGSSAGIKTYCKVLEKDGSINAVRFFGNTILNINNKKQVIS